MCQTSDARQVTPPELRENSAHGPFGPVLAAHSEAPVIGQVASLTIISIITSTITTIIIMCTTITTTIIITTITTTIIIIIITIIIIIIVVVGEGLPAAAGEKCVHYMESNELYSLSPNEDITILNLRSKLLILENTYINHEKVVAAQSDWQ